MPRATGIYGKCYMQLLLVFLSVGPGHILAERHFVILASTILFTIPLSLYRDMAKLGKVHTQIRTTNYINDHFSHLSDSEVSLNYNNPLFQVSLVSMLLTLVIIIIVAVRAVTLGPQMYYAKHNTASYNLLVLYTHFDFSYSSNCYVCFSITTVKLIINVVKRNLDMQLGVLI